MFGTTIQVVAGWSELFLTFGHMSCHIEQSASEPGREILCDDVLKRVAWHFLLHQQFLKCDSEEDGR